MTSAQLARVAEVTRFRDFDVQNDDAPAKSFVTYDRSKDSLFCASHGETDGCTCCARVRLSGILTNSVVEKV